MPPFDFVSTFREVKQNVDYLKDSDESRDLSSEIKYAESKFAQEFKLFRENVVAKLPELEAISGPEQKEIRLELAALEEGLEDEYKKCLNGEEGQAGNWQAKFTALTTKLSGLSGRAATASAAAAAAADPDEKKRQDDLKAFADEQKTNLNEFNTQKLEELATGLKRSIDAEKKKEPSYKLHEKIAEQYGYLPSAMVKMNLQPSDAKEMFVPKGYVEDPEYGNAAMVAVHDDHQFRKQLKALVLSDEKNASFTSKAFPDLTFEHKEFGPREQRESAWRPWPLATTPAGYKRAFGALMDLITIKHPGCKLVFNITPDDNGEYPKLKTAEDVNTQILPIMLLAKNEKKIPIELNPHLRRYLEELVRKAKLGGSTKKDLALIKSIEAVFKIELDSQRKATMDKLIGRDEKDWVQSIERMKLRTQPDDGLLRLLETAGIDANNIGETTYPTLFGSPQASAQYQAMLDQIMPTYRAEGDMYANKHSLIQRELNTLATRMDEAEQASILINAQISKLNDIAVASPEADILNMGEDSHLSKLKDLKETMDQNLNDLNARAAVLHKELGELNRRVVGVVAPGADEANERTRQNLIANIAESTRTASHLMDRGNNIKSNSANNIAEYEFQRQEQNVQARPGG